MIALPRFGFRWFAPGELRFTWGEFSPGWGFALQLCHFEEHWSLHIRPLFGNLYFYLCRSRSDPVDIVDSWGFSWNWISDLRTGIHFSWGAKTKIIDLPWAWSHVRTSFMLAGGSWERQVGWEKPEQLWTATYPYRYVLRSGEVQNVTATITVDEMEWRWRWLMALPFPRMVRRSIEVNFDGEVGDDAGSWKGGTIGCGYSMRKGEHPLQCIRRMERERLFLR